MEESELSYVIEKPSQFQELKLARDDVEIDAEVKLLLEMKLSNRISSHSWIQLKIPFK